MSQANRTIIVTGALGVVGRGVARSVRASRTYGSCRLIGLDTLARPFGLNSGLYDTVLPMPHCEASGYRDALNQVIEQQQPVALVVTPELEILQLAANPPAKSLVPPKEFAQVAISKERTLGYLAPAGLALCGHVVARDAVDDAELGFMDGIKKFWIRAIDDNTTGGAGAIATASSIEARDWIKRASNFARFEIAEFLPGRNLACTMLYKNGSLVAAVTATRLSYLLANVAPSGITGYTDHGRIHREPAILETCQKSIELLPGAERLSGVVTVDLKEDATGRPWVTEINLRYIGFVHAFALANANVVEQHIAVITGDNSGEGFSVNAGQFYRGIDSSLEFFPDPQPHRSVTRST